MQKQTDYVDAAKTKGAGSSILASNKTAGRTLYSL